MIAGMRWLVSAIRLDRPCQYPLHGCLMCTLESWKGKASIMSNDFSLVTLSWIWSSKWYFNVKRLFSQWGPYFTKEELTRQNSSWSDAVHFARWPGCFALNIRSVYAQWFDVNGHSSTQHVQGPEKMRQTETKCLSISLYYFPCSILRTPMLTNCPFC